VRNKYFADSSTKKNIPTIPISLDISREICSSVQPYKCSYSLDRALI